MLHIRLCLIHKGGILGEHLHKGLFQVHFFIGRWFAHSGWWHVVLTVPPSITLIALVVLIITPTLALILVLIVVAAILTLLLWLIKPRHILGTLYCLLSRLTFCTTVLSSTEFAQLPWASLNGIHGTLLSTKLFSKLHNMSNQVTENLVICATHSFHWCNPIPRPLIGVSSSVL